MHMVLEWTPEEASLLQDRPFSTAASEEKHDIFQRQSTGYLNYRTRGQETLYLCHSH